MDCIFETTMNDIELIEQIADGLQVLPMAKRVTTIPNFAIWSGSHSPHGHHYGKGGLAKHTREVIQLCLVNAGYCNADINKVNLFLAALYHDVGKLWDYEPTRESLPYGNSSNERAWGKNPNEYKDWKKTSHKNKIHHITRSIIVWQEDAKIYGVDEESKDEITHAILAHHGHKEWGSPVEPQTRLACMLHCCDLLSARMDDINKLQLRLNK